MKRLAYYSAHYSISRGDVVVLYISMKLNDDGVLQQRDIGKINGLSDYYPRPRKSSDL